MNAKETLAVRAVRAASTSTPVTSACSFLLGEMYPEQSADWTTERAVELIQELVWAVLDQDELAPVPAPMAPVPAPMAPVPAPMTYAEWSAATGITMAVCR